MDGDLYGYMSGKPTRTLYHPYKDKIMSEFSKTEQVIGGNILK